MREILFRGKRIDNGEWVEGGYYVVPDGEGGAIHRIAVSDCERFEYNDVVVDPSTISEFTGLTDKNGKKVFEGDIVKDNAVWHEEIPQIESHVNIVGVEKGCWIIFHDKWWDFLYTNASDVEVIGNIHDDFELLDNSELLEVEE